MMHKIFRNGGRCFLLLILFVMTGISSFAQNFTVNAPNVVEKDEIFRVVYTADAEIESFTTPTLVGLDLLAGPTSSRMTSTRIINGKRTDSYEVSYTLILRANTTGKVSVAEASATIGGKVYTAKGIEIEVVGNNTSASTQTHQGQVTGNAATSQSVRNRGEISSEEIFLRLSFSKTKVVKGEPIVATLKLYTRVPVAGFEDIRFPVFNGFWSQELETPQNINFVRENYNNQIYNSAVLRKYMLLPQQTGEITVDPAEMICLIQVRSSGGGRSMFDDFFDSYQTVKKRLTTSAVKINVSQLPSGAPSSFGGGVGEFSMNVSLNRDSIKAHEAGALMVEISGAGNLNLIETPMVDLPADFEKYDVKSTNNFTNGANGMKGKKVFEFPFIPRSEGIFEIPPVEYSYYNIAKGKYVTLKSDTLRLKVTPGDASMHGGQMVMGVNKQQVVNLGNDIRYISTSSARLAKKGAFFMGSILFFAVMALILLLSFVADRLLARHAKLKGDVKRTRNKKANKVARMRLKQAQVYMKENLHTPFYEELHKAMLGYISDKLAIQFSDMQRDTIREVLEQKGAGDENIDSFMTLLEECEMARYSQSGGAGAMAEQYGKAMETISNLENKL
ncbi:MAG: protein BatD [Bacteroidales bacterium]|nr:protein BatD [Bacteroidales bacterium]